jgi:CRP/FNR family transcriptional regulator, cyclic AMP receptor protein
MSEPGSNGVETVALLEVEPELRGYLAPEERELVARVAIPVQRLPARELDVDAVLADVGSFGAIILDGILLHRMSVGDHPGLRLLGPGDMLSRSGGYRTALLGQSTYRATVPLRLAMLDDRVLLTARRFPRLFAALQVRLADQHQRLAAQLVICQLPRVEDRLLALMWLLAETWGRVTASGTVLPMTLTHDGLGELIGARRPTVTLALKELAERGSLFRQDGEWLVLEPPPRGVPPAWAATEPHVALPQARWADLPRDGPPPGRETPLTRDAPAEPAMTVETLRESYRRTTGEVERRLETARATRERSRWLRAQTERQRRQLTRWPRSPAGRSAP